MNHAERQMLAAVTRKDVFRQPIEKWEAHKKGILHRGFTIALLYRDAYIMQHRKHLVFDRCFDLTCSSHPLIIRNKPQSMIEAVYTALLREWNIEKNSLLYEPIHKGSVYYKAYDKKSGYVEHEICHLFVSHTKTLPSPDLEFSYGFSLLAKNMIIHNDKITTKLPLTPWVKKLVRLL